ncbi:transaldolase [Litchfieldella anticariensis FP35 = DSM 16096]|uniref:Transaldolase n=1 Tax=Litchfieldella anticariensis (strain DSM 16096 / CECT 5854 / CIP 108499 / LMG 22089 / FP35) TaxID=1121939 RepID=S2L1R5_LITA3|nr:transaldolase [Halomonas anticariensis]EPC01599.1 transaldolase [Halomonas anticariensis FP35 = DSM 16096]
MPTQLDALKQLSLVVADTGNLNAIRRYQPQDATTNPSLILKAFELPGYQALIDEVLASIKAEGSERQLQVEQAVDELAVAMGTEIARVVPGRVSTEVAARLSFDTQASIRKAQELIERYQHRGVSKERVLIKLAATWEGIRAAEVLEKEGIQCNLTLLFSEAQAQACFDAGVFLVSPFVGRVTDWYKQATGQDFTPETDPGVQFVRGVCQRVRQGGYDTVVMGASFRTTGQVLALAGCPRLTISPALLEELAASEGEVKRQVAMVSAGSPPPAPLTEPEFRWGHNQDAMANDKLAEGIRRFAEDQARLEDLIANRLADDH